MTVVTYAGLQSFIAATVARTDTATNVVDWITLCEARIGRVLRVDQMLKRDTATITGAFGTLPTDFLAPLIMRLTTGTLSLLNFRTATQMADFMSMKRTGAVSDYGRIGTQFWFDPPPGGTDQAELIYYAAIPALSTINTTNWLLTAFPDVYVRGTMLEAGLFYEDDELVEAYTALFSEAIGAVKDAAKRDAVAANLKMNASGAVV